MNIGCSMNSKADNLKPFGALCMQPILWNKVENGANDCDNFGNVLPNFINHDI